MLWSSLSPHTGHLQPVDRDQLYTPSLQRRLERVAPFRRQTRAAYTSLAASCVLVAASRVGALPDSIFGGMCASPFSAASRFCKECEGAPRPRNQSALLPVSGSKRGLTLLFRSEHSVSVRGQACQFLAGCFLIFRRMANKFCCRLFGAVQNAFCQIQGASSRIGK